MTIFTLTNGRSGTKFLCDLLRNNAANCVCRHEPYFDWGNPTMFGMPISDHMRNDKKAIRPLLERKRKAIEKHRPNVYVETSHAFLKSYYDQAVEFFPDIRLIHLVRNPLDVAKSEANRESQIHKYRLPFVHYRGRDGNIYFRWALTRKEQIFQHFDLSKLSLFQIYLIQWIEVENRAISFLDRFDKHGDCFTLLSPRDINAPARIQEMLRFLGLELRKPDLVVKGRRNRTPGARTLVTEYDCEQAAEVLGQLPPRYLEIFSRELYVSYGISEIFQRTSKHNYTDNRPHHLSF
jgi:hypothetical protein